MIDLVSDFHSIVNEYSTAIKNEEESLLEKAEIDLRQILFWETKED